MRARVICHRSAPGYRSVSLWIQNENQLGRSLGIHTHSSHSKTIKMRLQTDTERYPIAHRFKTTRERIGVKRPALQIPICLVPCENREIF